MLIRRAFANCLLITITLFVAFAPQAIQAEAVAGEPLCAAGTA
jgi:hypothetical protein